MPLYDRPYMRDEPSRYGQSGRGPMRGMTLGMPKPTPAVKMILIINVIVFAAQMFLDRPSHKYPAGLVSTYLGVTVGAFWQVWRYITFQFLHAGFWHILLNMLGVYVLGSTFERQFGSRKFVKFYLSCGVVAGIAYVLIGSLSTDFPPSMPIIGASGGVYGLVLACAVFFPSIYIIFLFFPVPIRFASLIIFGAMILYVLQAFAAGRVGAAMSDVAHLGGAVAAAVWIWLIPRFRAGIQSTMQERNRGAWEKKLQKRAQRATEVNRILAKIQQQGLTSLTNKEKKTLREATEQQRREERELYR